MLFTSKLLVILLGFIKLLAITIWPVIHLVMSTVQNWITDHGILCSDALSQSDRKFYLWQRTVLISSVDRGISVLWIHCHRATEMYAILCNSEEHGIQRCAIIFHINIETWVSCLWHKRKINTSLLHYSAYNLPSSL